MAGSGMKPSVFYAAALAVAGTLLATPARASPYWIAWEGTELPEVQGPWLRGFGYGGAKRTINNGILTYDSLHDVNVWDFAYIEGQRKMDPEPSETFILEWSLKVERVIGRADPAVGVSSDEAWAVGFEFAEDRIFSVFEGYLQIPIEKGVFHAYQLASMDMRKYDLYVDGQLVRRGVFDKAVTQSYVGFGDGIQGAASLHHWDYLRFGVIPEPATVALVFVVLTVRYRRAA